MYFNHNITTDHYETSVDVSNWLKEAKSIIKEISKNGWEDVLQLFKSEEWYNKDIDRNREMVYNFKFVIFVS